MALEASVEPTLLEGGMCQWGWAVARCLAVPSG